MGLISKQIVVYAKNRLEAIRLCDSVNDKLIGNLYFVPNDADDCYWVVIEGPIHNEPENGEAWKRIEAKFAEALRK